MNALELRALLGAKVGRQTGQLATILKTLQEEKVIAYRLEGWVVTG